MTAAEAIPIDAAPTWLVSTLRRLLARVAVLGALLATVMATRDWADGRAHPELLAQGNSTALVGILLMLVALWLSPPSLARIVPFSAADAAAARQPFTWPRVTLKVLAMLLSLAGFAILVEVNTGVLGLSALEGMSHHVQFVLLVVSCVLPIWALSDRPLRLPRWRELSQTRRLELAFVAGLTLVALLLRLYDLEAVRAFVDEMNFIAPMMRFESNPSIPLLQPLGKVAAFPYLYPYLQVVAWDVIPSGLIAARVPAAIFGALTIPALYLFARQFFDWRMAALAAVLLTTHPVHLQLSRLGMNNAADPLFGVLAFALLVRGVRRGGTWHFAAAGVCMGLTQYFYEGGRLAFPALTLVWFLYLMVLFNWISIPRTSIAVFVATAVLVGAPVYLTLLGLNLPVTARLDIVKQGVSGPGDLWMTVYQSLLRFEATLAYFVQSPEPTEYALYYAGDYPFFHVYLIPALLLGIASIGRRLFTGAGSLLVMWGLGPMLLASYVSYEGGMSPRVLLAFPIYMLVCALGVTDLLRLLWGSRTRAVLASMAVIVLVIAVLDVGYYFGVHVHRLTQQEYEQRPEQAVSFHAREYPDGTQVILLSRELVTWPGDFNLIVRALNRGLTADDPAQDLQDAGYIREMSFDPNTVFYIHADDKRTHLMLEKRFVLSPPIRWPQPYNPPGIEFVSYRPLADRYATPPVRRLSLPH